MVLAVTTLGTLLYSIIVFLLIIMLLVIMLLYARDKLSPKGDVTLHINERDLVVSQVQIFLQHFQATEYFCLRLAGVEVPVECANARLWREADQFFLLKQDFLQERTE